MDSWKDSMTSLLDQTLKQLCEKYSKENHIWTSGNLTAETESHTLKLQGNAEADEENNQSRKSTKKTQIRHSTKQRIILKIRHNWNWETETKH